MNYYFQDTIYPIRFNSYFSLNFSVFAGKSPIYTYNNRGGISMKPWKDVTLTDDYLFSQIMKDEDFCKLFLEMLMGIKITKVLYLEAQKEVNLFPRRKASVWMSTLTVTTKSTTSKCRRCTRQTWSNGCGTTTPPLTWTPCCGGIPMTS